MGNGTDLAHALLGHGGAINQCPSCSWADRGGGLLQASQAHGQTGEILSRAIVEFTRPSPSLLFLQAEHTAGKVPELLFGARALGNVQSDADGSGDCAMRIAKRLDMGCIYSPSRFNLVREGVAIEGSKVCGDGRKLRFFSLEVFENRHALGLVELRIERGETCSLGVGHA